MGSGTDLYTSELTIHVFCSPQPDASCGEYVMQWGLVLGVAYLSELSADQPTRNIAPYEVGGCYKLQEQ